MPNEMYLSWFTHDTTAKFMDAISTEERLFLVLLCPEMFVCVNKRNQLFHEDGDFMTNNVAVIYKDCGQSF